MAWFSEEGLKRHNESKDFQCIFWDKTNDLKMMGWPSSIGIDVQPKAEVMSAKSNIIEYSKAGLNLYATNEDLGWPAVQPLKDRSLPTRSMPSYSELLYDINDVVVLDQRWTLVKNNYDSSDC
jgi:hypothetical protein